MANGLFNLPGYLKDKEGEEALLQYAENPDISLTGQVNQLRGGDDFQAQFENLKKLPSTIPKMNQETRDLYGKYNKFLQFYGASSGDYSGSSAFQSGLTSALDMDMIQDLLEE